MDYKEYFNWTNGAEMFIFLEGNYVFCKMLVASDLIESISCASLVQVVRFYCNVNLTPGVPVGGWVRKAPGVP